MSAVTRAGENRRTETPNAVMSTLASPTTAGSESLSLWKVEIKDSTKGPLHSYDSEQIWTVLDGRVTIRVADDLAELAPGDTIVIPAESMRQIETSGPVEMIVCGHADAVMQAADEPQPRGTPAWIA